MFSCTVRESFCCLMAIAGWANFNQRADFLYFARGAESASWLGGSLDRPLSPSFFHVSATSNSKLANEEKSSLRLEFFSGRRENYQVEKSMMLVSILASSVRDILVLWCVGAFSNRDGSGCIFASWYAFLCLAVVSCNVRECFCWWQSHGERISTRMLISCTSHEGR